jgi:hypothetical protein
MPPLLAAFAAAANATAAAAPAAATAAAPAAATAAVAATKAAATAVAANATAAVANATAKAAVKSAGKIVIGWQGGVVIATLAIALIVMGMDLIGPDLVFGTLASIYMVSGIITMKEGAAGFANTVRAHAGACRGALLHAPRRLRPRCCACGGCSPRVGPAHAVGQRCLPPPPTPIREC